MKLLCALVIVFAGTSSYGAANAIFSSTGDKVAIIIQGPAGDKDAINLYNALNLPVTESANFFEKSGAFTELDDTPNLTFQCRISKTVADFGSCTVTIFKSKNAMLFPDKKGASYVITSDIVSGEASRLASLFNCPSPETKYIFVSSDSRFTIRNLWWTDVFMHMALTYSEI